MEKHNKIMLFFARLHVKLDLCYTLCMNFDRHIWEGWAKSLHRWGVKNLAASLLEALGPLAVFGAQVVYILQPFAGRTSSRDHLHVLAEMLEQPEQRQSFVRYLREG